jgi:hypothetical protein
MKEGHVVNFLIDGKPATAGKTDWDGQVLEADNLVEYNDTTISPELLTKLAEAKTVDGWKPDAGSNQAIGRTWRAQSND